MNEPSILELAKNFSLSNLDALSIISNLWKVIYNIWSYPLFLIDKQNPVAISNLIIASILFYVGLKVARSTSRLLRKRVTRLVGAHTNASTAIEKISYYILLSIAMLIALDIANVPLTAFTFVGGALAIGLGFGSQNIINNFISGLIMMFEQPIRIGDVIEYDKIMGTVANIGARCTKILTFDNVDIIVPNSTLLQSTIVNFTLTDEGKCRKSIELKVHMNNDVVKVHKMLTKIFKNDTEILQDPEPLIAISSAKDFYVTFTIYYWIQYGTSNSNTIIVTNLFFQILEKMKENNMQLDYHPPYIKEVYLQ
ncbi:mechanosensitive ion channel family protein [Rickettsiales endosymbiont of Stachyamoeba lipophora]|uniref:mechanosensitive ion channel family protein n=1 Tax=Rickettsiales endosymbiont of Stachyamoeba lipophora TaxID=2486578 RepID=UPI000F6474D4|nr:mechanosensitive ion channel domain-containing protein [Rickettsiales endosymbiont of Stachyamoeba lipophora]AZL15031.1 hypothetical protein EF513_00405 [Rickettsiales endosymbiont of Stachyamoeba lipophora]